MTNFIETANSRVMHTAADAHIAGYRWPDGGMQAMTPEQLRELMAAVFAAGYTAGRESRASRPRVADD